MNLPGLAFRSLRRKRLRSALTIGGVAIAVAVLISLLGFDAGYQQALTRDVDRMGYQVLVTAKGCPYEAATLMLKGGGGLRYMDQAVYERIVKDARIEQIAPQLVTTVYDREKNEGQGGIAMYLGIEPSYLKLKPWMAFKSGGWFSAPDAAEAILGVEAAELEQRVVGDEIYISGKDRVLKVVGILSRTGSQDDGVVFAPLRTVQHVFNLTNKISGIGIKLKDMGKLHAFEEDLYNEPAIQVVSLAQVKGTIFNLMSSARALTNSVAAVAVIVAIIGVMNTILMSVFERTREIGVLKALGASRGDVFRLVWYETAIICAVGGFIGELAALLGTRVVETVLRRILPYVPTGRLVEIAPALLGYGLLGAIVAGLLAGVYPAWRAAGMRPVEAIRSAE